MAIRVILAVLATSKLVFAGSVDIPEIGVASATGALSIIAGAALVLRSRRNKNGNH